MDEERRSVNFTVVPDEDATIPRTYSNFCSIQNSPLDFTLTFCEMLPLSERELKQAESSHVVLSMRTQCGHQPAMKSKRMGFLSVSACFSAAE